MPRLCDDRDFFLLCSFCAREAGTGVRCLGVVRRGGRKYDAYGRPGGRSFLACVGWDVIEA